MQVNILVRTNILRCSCVSNLFTSWHCLLKSWSIVHGYLLSTYSCGIGVVLSAMGSGWSRLYRQLVEYICILNLSIRTPGRPMRRVYLSVPLTLFCVIACTGEAYYVRCVHTCTIIPNKKYVCSVVLGLHEGWDEQLDGRMRRSSAQPLGLACRGGWMGWT